MDPPPPAEATITEEVIGTARTPVHDDHDDSYGVPTLDELGFDTEGLKPPVWIGGETEALGKYFTRKEAYQVVIEYFHSTFSSFRTSLGKEGVGGLVRSSQNVAAVAARESNRLVALPQIRVLVDSSLLLPVD